MAVYFMLSDGWLMLYAPQICHLWRALILDSNFKWPKPLATRQQRPNGADRHSAHSGTTQQGAQQPAATEDLRETNVELREENPKASPENLINTFCGAP